MEYLKGTKQKCEGYNQHVAQERNLPAGTITKWAHIIERDGEYYIPKHPDYPAFDGLVPAELPEIEEPE